MSPITPDVQLIRCTSCGATNRVRPAQLEGTRKAICGRCKTPLPVAAGPITVKDATFATDVEQSPLPVLLDMWAPWCGPCRMVAPIVEELAAEMAGRVRVGKMNVDENPITAERFNVRSIPTLLIFNRGQEIDRIVGVQPKAQIAQRLARATA
ncbi:MAG TPA: thioredoxin [Vicinamibacterales bacterium]|jgi:thioredoxin 2|nr:thioredoxin [Vicinamibacterales bacterium]